MAVEWIGSLLISSNIDVNEKVMKLISNTSFL